ncbi:hypothetical protein E2562_029674 [Oryza meyeriana var. granulata]|uniref:Uncharacterized protein n=1 Tax=Oryza meyeriana var. granulata TaxID=110450 RepID=A0A6G1C0R7_9ORYZ|nr:hypothetical protein E2562_029674 [Oryza meyeriana var. granulata]
MQRVRDLTGGLQPVGRVRLSASWFTGEGVHRRQVGEKAVDSVRGFDLRCVGLGRPTRRHRDPIEPSARSRTSDEVDNVVTWQRPGRKDGIGRIGLRKRRGEDDGDWGGAERNPGAEQRE